MSRTARRRNGFMYSVFAIFMVGALLTLIAQQAAIEPLRQDPAASRLDESFYFLESVQSDITRVTQITAQRTLAAAANIVATNEAPLPAPGPELVTGFRNGTMNGSEQLLLEDSSFSDWETRIEAQARNAGWRLNVTLNDVTIVPDEPGTATVGTVYQLVLRDEPTAAQYDRTITRNLTLDLTNITDPLFYLETDGRSSRSFQSCSYSYHARLEETGTESYYDGADNWTSGRAVVRPSNGGLNGINDRGETVLAVADVCSYSDTVIQDTISDFKGVVSGASGGIAADGSTICGDADSSGFNAFVGGASGVTANLSNGTMTVLTEEGVWTNNIIDEVNNACYFDDPEGPNFFGRLAGNTSAAGNPYDGWGSFVFIPELPTTYQDPSRSAIDHVYFDDATSPTTHNIKGVTDHYSWFQLDQAHIDEWGITALSYD